jgi:hypothetical protein
LHPFPLLKGGNGFFLPLFAVAGLRKCENNGKLTKEIKYQFFINRR